MRYARLLLFLAVLLYWFASSGAKQYLQKPEQWQTGFWFWSGSAASVAIGAPVDAIFCHVGNIRIDMMFRENSWRVSGSLPEHIPPAREYWLVFRSESPGVPSADVIPQLISSIDDVKREASRRGLQIRGVQLDIDSPTAQLSRYAEFLRAFRVQLPAGSQISITALLDWFRSDTALAEALKHVDEFVPQFYDVQESARHRGGITVATPVESARWQPVFARYGKRFRIGISTFGRSRAVPSATTSRGFVLLADLKLIDVATHRDFRLRTSRTKAQELVLTYDAAKPTRIGYSDFRPGDALEFILPTPEGISAAVAEAKRMGPNCAGVVFFRWPSFDESLAEQPGEVLRAAGVVVDSKDTVQLHTSEGGCATVHCVDLYLTGARPLSPQPARYRIRSSADLEYFVPAERMPARMSAPAEIELFMPPYCCRARMYLGRAVTANRAEFKLATEESSK